MTQDKFYSNVATKKRISRADFGLMILLLVTVFPLTYKIISPIMILTGLGAYTKDINSTLYIAGIFLTIPRIKIYVRPIDIILYFLFALVFYFSQFIYPISQPFVIENAHDILLYFVPFYFLGLLIDFKKDMDLVRYVMRIAFLIAVFWELCLLAGLVETMSEGVIGEQMDFSYSLLVVVTCLFVEYFNSHKKFELIAFILGSLLIMFAGTRGPMVLWALFIVSFLLLFHKFKRNDILIKVGIIASFILIYIYSVPIITALLNLSTRLGMSTKVFDAALGGSLVNLQDSSNRDLFYESMIQAIHDDYFGFGYGFGSDRYFSPTGGYAHNFALEILVQLGVYGGTIVFIALLVLFLKTYKKTKGTTTEGFWLVILFWGLMSLQFSKSWLIHPGFFIMIGYYVSILRKNRIDM